jgi:xylose isomerase-like TIM barrel protein
MKITRRELGKVTLSALPVASLLGIADRVRAQRPAKPNSKFAGVQIGMNVPYNFGGREMDPDEVLDRCLKLNVNALELRSQPVESFLGSPAAKGQKVPPEEMRKWRTGVSMDRVRAFRRKYEDAGVMIEIVKYDGIYNMADDEVDYCFNLARTLGARAISCEIDLKHTQRIGQFADKHKLMVGFHGHAATIPAHWETAFGQAKYSWANLDIGHFVAGNNTSPVPFLKQHHARITHIHVKDRKMHEGATVPFGQGDVPIKDVLQLIRDNKWPMQATIEFEYPVPTGSDRMAELVKCVEFCRQALVS